MKKQKSNAVSAIKITYLKSPSWLKEKEQYLSVVATKNGQVIFDCDLIEWKLQIVALRGVCITTSLKEDLFVYILKEIIKKCERNKKVCLNTVVPKNQNVRREIYHKAGFKVSGSYNDVSEWYMSHSFW